MPFKSKKQAKACYAKKRAGTAGSWNCDEWSRETKQKGYGGKKHTKKAKGK